MPGISPFISILIYRPSMIGVIVVLLFDFVASAPGAIHIVFSPSQTPASLARTSCILPGVPAIMQACISSIVQPSGSFISGWPAVLELAAGSAMAMETTVVIGVVAATIAA